ncbi:MAG: hypothetical protein WBK76_01360 [Candidatus Saccharimonadales bacterium]|nr:hypothetical protein [Patescibacteria group bacterium]
MNDTATIKSNKRKLIWGLVSLIGPTALLIGAILLYALINFLFAAAEPTVVTGPGVDCMNNNPYAGVCAPQSENESLFADQGPVRTIINVILFLTGALVVITWLPGIIVGIILLATRKPIPAQPSDSTPQVK